MPRCKHCKDKFTAKYFLQKFCLNKDECIKAFVEETKKQKEVKEKKEWAKEKKERKEAALTYSEWLNLFQTVFNTYIRLRDSKDGCISCGTTKNVQYAAGHFFTVGGFPNVRFDEDNVHKQCNRYCNMENSGNIHNYRPRLIEKIGQQRFDELEFRARNKPLKLSIPEIKEKITEYKQKIKQLKDAIN